MKNIAISILLLLLLVVSPLRAAIPTQYDGSSWWNTESLSTEGTEFYVTFMKNLGKEIKDEDFFISLYATAHEEAKVTVTGIFTPLSGGISYPWSRIFIVPADGMNNIIIPHEVGYMENGGKTSADVQQKGIMVTSDKPIALYSSNSNINSYDATTIYPIKALYKEYVMQTYSQDKQATEFAIVSAKNNNQITIEIQETVYNIFTGEVDKVNHKIIDVTLNCGESYLYRTEKGNISLTGTTICATEPIAVFQGGQMAAIPMKTSETSHIYTQTISTDAWGRVHVITQTKNQPQNVIRITAAEPNTKIYRNNETNPIAILQPLETYEELIDWNVNSSGAVVYTSSRAVECYLYETGKNISNDIFDAPTFTDITPLEHSIHRTLFATFKYRYDTENELSLNNYVNVVIPVSGIGSITLDGEVIRDAEFRKIPTKINGIEYAYAQLKVSEGAHVLYSEKAPFVAHVYGFANNANMGIISYSYSAGRNILHPAWMLINGVRTDRIEVCEDEMPVKFTSVINYDYTDVRWEHHLQGHSKTIKTPTLTLSDGTKATGDSIIDRYYDDIPRGLPLVNHMDTVYMIVSRKTPICENIIIDTIKAIVQVNDTFQIDENYESNLNANVCYGEEFTVHHQGKDYKYKADTSTEQYYNGELIRLKLNEPYSFIDSLTTQFGCDSIINQIRILRPTYDIVVYDTICFNNLPYTTTLYDTQANLMGKNISVDIPQKEKDKLVGHQDEYIKPFIKDTAVQLTTIYGCDSIINLRLVVLPIYEIIKDTIEECKDTINPYIWEKHTDKNGHPLVGHKIYRKNENDELIRMGYNDIIPLSIPGEYTYVDSLKTRGCKTCYDAPGCDSVYILPLIVKDQLKKQERKSLCDNKSFEWLDSLYLGINFDQEMIPQPYKANKQWRILTKNTHLKYTVPSTQEEVCDSLYTMDVTWCPTYKADVKETHICENESYTYQPRYPKTHPHDKTYKWTCEVNADGTKKVGIYNLVDTVETIVKCDGNKGCDSIVHHVVYVHPVYVDTLYETECQNYTSLYKWSEITEPLIWDKQQNKHISPKEIPLSSAGDFVYIDSTYTKTCIDCRNGYGCDSILVLCLHVNPIYDKIESRSLCENDTLHWRGKVYIGGKASDKISVGSSKRFWANPRPKLGDAEDLYRMPHTYADINHKWNGNKYTDSVYFKTKDGCDSIYWLELTVYPSYEIHDTLHICDNERTSWQGATYAGSKYNGSAIHKYDASVEWRLDTMSLATNSYSCDSIRILHLMVHPTYDEIYTDTICQDYPYEWIGHTNRYVYDSVAKKDIYIAKSIPTNEPGLHTYVDRLKTTTCADCNQGGCDSIWTLRLYVKPTLTSTVSLTICPEQLPFEYGENGKVATAEGTYNDTIRRDVNGVCDSIVTYDISVSDENRLVIPIVRCENEVPYSYDYGTTPSDNMRLTNLTKTGIYLDTIKQAGTCNQIIVLDLTVNDTTTTDTTYYLCMGDTYVDEDFSSIIATKDTSYVKRLERANSVGCDSVVYVTVKFGQTYEDPTQEQILCESDSAYVWEIRDTHGTYRQTLKWGNLHEQVLDTTLYDTLYTISPYNCDSVVSIHIVVKPTVYNEYFRTICPEQVPYNEFGNRDEYVTTSGTYSHYIAGGSHRYGCDSIEILHLTISDSIVTYIEQIICNNELPYNHISAHATPELVNLTKSGIYRQTLDAASGCDSTVVLQLTVNDTTTTDTTYHLCMGDTYVDKDFNSITTTKDTSYVKRLERANSVGCDSVVYVTVKFGQTYEDPTQEQILCESDSAYVWEIRDTHGTYRQTLKWGNLHEQVLDTTLYDTLHTAYPFYCDSVTSVRIIVNPTTVREYDKEWCASAGPYSYGDHGKTASSTGIYIDTLAQKNHYGCDSVEILYFVWLDSIYYHDTIVICDNKVYEKHSKLYVGDKYASFGGVYDATLFDSVRVYTVGLHHDTITFLTPSGCDSTYYITIEVQPTHYSKQERDVCQYEDTQYEAMYNGLGGKVKTDVLGDVVFIDTVPAISNGCDSIIHMTYHIRPHYHFSQGEITLCQTMDSMWVWYNEEGDPQDTISLSEGNRTYTLGTQYETIYGCDSTYGITVYVAPTYHMYDTITLCENDSIHWQNVLFTGSQYTAYGKTYDIADFDSVKTSLEDGEYDFSVRYGTETYDCDSVYYLHLTINPVRRKTIEIRQCQTDEGRFYENLNKGVGGYLPAKYLSDSLTRNDTIQTILGCDSIITLHYYVDSVYRYGVEYTFCQDTINNMQEWVDEEGVSHGYVLDISKPGDFRLSENHTTIFGCDSTYGVTWHVDPIYRYDTIIDMCENQRIEWQNTLYTGDSVINKTSEDTVVLAPGVYHEYRNYLTIAGCDSSYHAQINVHAVYDTLTQITVCESDGFVWRQNDHMGIYVDTVVPVAYCDTIRLFPFEAANPQAKRDTIMRYAERMLETIYGCDSLSRLMVTVKPTYFFLTDTTICSNDRVLYRGKYFSSKDTVYTEYLNTEDNCDSIYQLRLHVRPTFMNVRHVTMCDNETLYHPSQNRDDIVWRPGDEIRDPEWEYYDMIYTDTDGCDSIYRYYLLIHPSYLFVDTLTLCSADSILLHGGKYVGEKIEFPTEKYIEPYKAFYADTLLTIHGCDSIYGIYATIYPAYRHCDTITICDDESTTWRKHYYEGNMIGNKPGDGLAAGHHVFRDSFKTIYGCDSIYELHLYITPTHLFEEHITKCADENLTWRKFNLDHVPVGTHFYYDSLQTIGYGCDSVYHLYLTINDTTSEVIYDTICRTESYNLHGVHIYEPGYYYDTTLNEWGCHYFTHLYLEVIEPTVPIAWADSICADDDAYDLYYTYTGRDPIAYSVLYDDEGHYYGFEDIIDEPIETEEQLSMLTIPMPLRDGDKTKYPKPNYYNIRLVLDNGICTNPDLCSTDTSVVLSYPSWITQQRFGDVIALYNEKYNGGYYWSHYQWYHGDTLLVGETHEYLYVPTGLVVGDQYHVRLIREGEVQDFQTCPITIVADPIVEDFAPTMGYLSVVPTCVCADNSVAYILSRKDGMYRVTYNGVLVKEGVFRADVTEVPLSNVEGIYMFQLWSPDTPEEPYRCIKVLVSKKCPNYDIPF